MRAAASRRVLLLLLTLCAVGSERRLWAQEARLTLAEVVRTTLARNASVALGQWDVQAQAGALHEAAGAFDPQVSATVAGERARTPSPGDVGEGPGDILSRGLDYTAGIEWRLRPGVVVSPNLSFSRQGISTEGVPTRNTGEARLDFLIPLQRGWGGGALLAAEHAATAALDASREELRHVRALRVRDAVTAYWEYVAARRSLEVLQESEERARTLVQQTEILIQADARPASDRFSVQANLASKRAARLAGEGVVASARQALVLVAGLGVERFASLPPPADSLPAAPVAASDAVLGDSAVLAQAIFRRADLAAARSRVVAARSALHGARNEVAPRLDMRVGVGYTGLEDGQDLERLFSPFYTRTRGFNAQVEVVYGFPLARNVEMGRVMRSTAADRRAAIYLEELARAVTLDVALAAETLRRSREELEVSREAVRLHGESVDSEIQKFRLGTSTLLEVIQVEDGRTAAMLGWVATRRRYAVAVAQLHFQAGTLLDGDAETVDVDRLVAWVPAVARL
jgi:outer membrane protein TolC